MKNHNDYIREKIKEGMDTPASVILKSLGDEVILYGIGTMLIPLPDGNATLVLINDDSVSDCGGEVYILIRKGSRDFGRVERGELLHYNNKKLFVRGIVVDSKYTRPDETIHTVILLDPTYELRELK
jgi:hypothetical protein